MWLFEEAILGEIVNDRNFPVDPVLVIWLQLDPHLGLLRAHVLRLLGNPRLCLVPRVDDRHCDQKIHKTRDPMQSELHQR